jgi:hypothetical protein
VRHKGKLLVAALAGTLGLLALPAGAAYADSTTPLTQLTGFHQMVVDDVGAFSSDGYVFLSEGTSSDALATDGPDWAAGIVVTDLSGNYVTTLDAGNGVEGLALSADGGTLYAALGGGNAVAAIDVSSITPSTTDPTQTFYRLTGWDTPFDLAIQSGKLWVSYNPVQSGIVGESTIGYFDLSQADPSFVTPTDSSGAPIMGNWYSAPVLAADPSDRGKLVAAEPDQSPAEVASFDVATGTVTVLAAQQRLMKDGNENCENAGDMAIVPGGSQVIMACGWPYAHYYYNTADLSLLGDYATTAYPNAVAVASGTGVVALGVGTSPSPGLYLYNVGGGPVLNEYNVGGSSGTATLVDRGLAISPDGSELYAVTTDGSTYSLHVFDSPAGPVTLWGPPTVQVGSSVTLSGHLTPPAGTAAAGATVTVTRTDGGATVTLPPVTVGADGSFTFADTPVAAGPCSYTVSYGSSSRSYVVAVTPLRSTLYLTGPMTVKGGTVNASGDLILGTSTSPRIGTPITITRSLAGGGSTMLPTVSTEAGGGFTISDKLKTAGTYTYTAHYTGDSVYAPATASFTVTIGE